MNRTQIRRYLGYFVIIAVSITVITVFAVTLFRKDTYNRTIVMLERSNTGTRNLLTFGTYDDIDEFIKKISVDDLRITVIRSDGTVVADSQANISQLDNHGNRPEVFSAFNGVEGISTRYSESVGNSMIYVAAPLADLAGEAYVIRSSMSEVVNDEALGDIIGRIVYTGLITFIILSFISYASERRIIGPLADIQKAAESYSAGNLDYHISIPEPEDVKVVADTLNQMASTLKARLNDISKSKVELDAVFASITEGVVVLDGALNIRHLNRAALGFVETDKTEVLHRNLIEVFRSSELQKLAEDTLESHTPIERLIRFNRNQDLIFQVHGTRIMSSTDQRFENAIVLVMNDITKTQQLENMRRDFVANVSHELKTPITNIKGFLETLTEDGVLDDRETVERFLSISVRNADRLNAIIDDLLSLSRLEQQGKAGLDFDKRSLSGIVAAAFQACGPKAMEKKIELLLQGDRKARVYVNSLLMEQALSNLIGNAVKYSDEGASVVVNILQKEDMVDIEVIDRGIGIPERDLPRIFERFYRVDKARSRELGGTGLGLSIVKHIAIVHDGMVKVYSVPGKGCTFTLSLPAADRVLQAAAGTSPDPVL